MILIGQYQLGLPVFVSKNESFLMGDPKRVSRNLGSPRKFLHLIGQFSSQIDNRLIVTGNDFLGKNLLFVFNSQKYLNGKFNDQRFQLPYWMI